MIVARRVLGEVRGTASAVTRALGSEALPSYLRLFSTAPTRGLSTGANESKTKASVSNKDAHKEEEKGGLERKGSSGAATKEYLDEVRWRIFGTYVGNGLRSGRKVLRKNLIGDKVVGWYPQSGPFAKIHKADPLWEDPDVAIQKERLERYKRRGKGPPKKGAGKRATRK